MPGTESGSHSSPHSDLDLMCWGYDPHFVEEAMVGQGCKGFEGHRTRGRAGPRVSDAPATALTRPLVSACGPRSRKGQAAWNSL